MSVIISPMKRRFRLIFFLLLAALTSGCTDQTASIDSDKDSLTVTVSILPLQYLAKRIGGDRVNVHVLVGPGRSPHTYEPTPRQMAALDKSSLFVLAGVPYEASLLPRLKSAYPDLTYLSIASAEDEAGHVHGEGENRHDDLDPHSWLDPRETAHKADLLAERLSEIDPSNREVYEANLAQLRAELQSLDSQLTAIFSTVKRKTFYVYHPAYGWLARRYGLTQVAIEQDGKEPSSAQLAAVIEQARRDSVRTIFVQQQFAQTSARAVAEAIGARLVVVDPLAKDYVENLRALTLALATELRRP